MGLQRSDFQAEMQRVLLPHVGPLQAHQVESRLSRNGHYISLTLTFEAQSRDQIDSVYHCLTAHPWVKLVL